MMGGMDSMVKPPSLNRDNSVLHSKPIIDKPPAPPSLSKAKSSIEKNEAEESTAANSKAKASTGDSFLRPPSPSTQK